MHVKMEHVRTCFYFELCKGIDCGFKVDIDEGYIKRLFVYSNGYY